MLTIAGFDDMMQQRYHFMLPLHVLPSLALATRDTISAHGDEFPAVVLHQSR